MSLSSCVVDEEVDVERHFSLEGLRQLFQLNEETLCDTHDTFRCKRCFKGKQQTKPPKSSAGATSADTSNWNHFSFEELSKVYDSILKKGSSDTGAVTFVFENKSSES
jgi:DNA repair and recombination protein RAD54 and RAD54-like protein